MGVKKTVAKGMQEYSDYKKEHELMVVDRNRVVPLPLETRIDSYRKMFAKNFLVGTFLLDPAKESVEMHCGGLAVIDDGHHVYFNATKKKEDVDMNVAEYVAKCVARHLYLEDEAKPYISTNRDGSRVLYLAFEEACKKAKPMLDQKVIARLKAQKTK